MKIIQVTPGLLPIPPNGWGAVEKIIWEYHQNLLSLGHDSQIKYLDDIVPGEQHIVHVHVANLALLCKERGIPYIFTMHDHHAYLYGKDSDVFKENYNALKHSMIGFVPASYLVGYFDLPNVKYFSHGVNADFFKPGKSPESPSILCVANNGFILDQSEDRKGFGFAIEAAKRLNLPITICGPENNKKYFEANPSDYELLTIKYNLTETELCDEYKNHSLFVHASNLEAGHPNLTILEAMSSGLPVIGTCEEGGSCFGFYPIERDADQIVYGIEKVLPDLNNWSESARKTAERLSWGERVKSLVSEYKSVSSLQMKHYLINNYTNTKIKHRPKIKAINKFLYSFIENAKFEVLGQDKREYEVRFIDRSTGIVDFSTKLTNNSWASPAKKYFVDWRIEVYSEGNLVDSHDFNAEEKRVYIHLDSKALGDTIAWFPYVEEFRKKHNCRVICSSFRNDLFGDTYPDIEFVSPGSVVPDLYAMYTIGWYYFENGNVDFDKNKRDFRTIPLQQTASDFLGIDFSEIKPLISLPQDRGYVLGDYISIAPHASSHAKYWNRPGGWQSLVDWFNTKNVNTAMITHEPLGDEWHDSKLGGTLKNLIDRTGDFPLDNRINEIKHSKMFIGVSSGLSWLAWALNVPTVIISGFTEEFLEPSSCIRIINKNVCHGCQTKFRLDAGDWEWCPVNKNTEDMFVCTKEISSEMVIKTIEENFDI